MNIFELIIFLAICAAFGFIGHLVSPRYGWIVGAVPAVPVLILLLRGSFKEMIKESRPRRQNRSE
jgi:hypothetical protein